MQTCFEINYDIITTKNIVNLDEVTPIMWTS